MEKPLNLPMLERLYKNVSVRDNRYVQIHLDPHDWGKNIYMEDAIWYLEPEFIQRITFDVLRAFNIEPGQMEAQGLKHRAIVKKDGKIILEFRFEAPNLQ